MKKKNSKLATHFLVAVMLLSSVLGALGLCQINVNAASINSIDITGTYNYSAPKQLIENINRDRTSGGAFYYDDKGNKVNVNKINALVFDKNLEEIAEQRAAELVVSYSNTRPTQNSFTTCTYGSMSSYQEYIFKDTEVKTGDYMYQNLWFSYGRGGAAATMMRPDYMSVAAACFTYDGTTYWVLEFSLNTTNQTFASFLQTRTTTKTVEYDATKFTPLYELSLPNSFLLLNSILTVGENFELSGFTLEIYRGKALEETIPHVESSSRFTFSITASDSSVKIVNKNTICPTKLGSFTLTVSVKDGSKTIASKKIDLKSNSNSMTKVIQNGIPSVTYTGSAINDVNLDLQYNGIKLTKGSDYTITGARNNTNVTDTAYVTVKGTANGRFIGTKEFQFKISPMSISGATVSCSQNNTQYTGKEITPSLSVKLGNKTLTTSDYSVSYSAIINPGTYEIKISGKGNYTGNTVYKLTVNKYTIKDNDVSQIDNQTYTGKSIVPNVTVNANGNKLKENTDYTVTYSNNTNPGTATVTIVMQGNYYTGTITRTFEINKYTVKNTEVSQLSDQVYNGTQITPDVTVEANGVALQKNIDYTIEYKDNVNVGTATATITMQGNYAGSFTRQFNINQCDISSAEVSSIPDQKYTGTEIKPALTVTINDKVLTEGTDYELTYTNNTKSGKASITIEGINCFSGQCTVDFNIIDTSTPMPTPSKVPTATPSKVPTATPSEAPSSTPVPTSQPNSGNSFVGGNSTSATPTSSPVEPTSAPVPTKAPELDVGNFVDRCYEVALSREADEAGFGYWKDSLTNGQACGAQVGYGFIFSPEYIMKDNSNEQYVKDLYRMFFDREPDNAGFNYWVEQLNNNIAGREEVFAGFANSVEFYNLCLKYGVVAGYYLVGVPNDQQGGINCFVARMYEVCLGRLPDQGGQAGWVIKLHSGEATGSTCAYGFVFSPEFIEMELSNVDFVSYMYRAFFGREADEGGLSYWTEQLKSGTASRADIFAGFSGSIEFDALCQSYGIQR